jgi:hypothetical protein
MQGTVEKTGLLTPSQVHCGPARELEMKVTPNLLARIGPAFPLPVPLPVPLAQKVKI